jgi:translation initiation factor IF-2
MPPTRPSSSPGENSPEASAKKTNRKATKEGVGSSGAGDSAVRSAFKPITASRPEPAKPTPKATPPPPPPPKEAVSLIDEKPKTLRKRTTKPEDSPRVLPPISRILEPEVQRPAPVPAPVEQPAASAETSSESDVTVAPDLASEPSTDPEDDKTIHLKAPVGVKDLSAALGLRPFEIIRDLMGLNIFASINSSVDAEAASQVCKLHGFKFERERREKGAGIHKVEEKVVEPPKEVDPPKKDELKLRAPIVTFMGHVDHGKTTLMDTIRKARVAAGEAGGITQHIGAYSVEKGGQHITFLDTPGHAAFSAMRARGANVTDIVVLVVAADDGLMPQTLEAISHAKNAKVQIIVAITKMDTAGANPDRVKAQLQEKGLAPEDWGGDTICVPVSAIKNQGIDKLLESILLVAEVSELKATSGGVARATVIEAQFEQGRGPAATVIVRTGTLKVGSPVICGSYHGKIKALLDEQGKPLKSAGPSTPAKVVGLSGLPNAGDELVVMESERAANQLSQDRLGALRASKLTAPARPTLENLFASMADDQKKVLRLVIKSDVQGSLEAICASVSEIKSNKVDTEVVHHAVGPISENDVLLAAAAGGVIIGFNVKVENSAAATAKREGVQIKLYSIIYELLDQVKEAMAGLLDPVTRESALGHAEVRRVFNLSKGVVAGCYVTDGRILRSGRARVLRGRQPIYDGGIGTLRRFQEDVKEVKIGFECGIRLGDFDEYEVGDIIECYQLEKVAQKL